MLLFVRKPDAVSLQILHRIEAEEDEQTLRFYVINISPLSLEGLAIDASLEKLCRLFLAFMFVAEC